MTRRRILVTGASGCVGHYVIETLAARADLDIVALVRDRRRLALPAEMLARVTILERDLCSGIETVLEGIGRIDDAVLIAAAWGGEEAWAVNLHGSVDLAEKLIDQGCTRIVYFATASVLESDLTTSSAAREYGTDYIRSKAHLVDAMERFASRADIIGLFPTLVLGGKELWPWSHFARLLKQAARWARLAGFFRVDGRLHFIHAEDIANIISRLLLQSVNAAGNARRFVLGQPVITVNEFVNQYCDALGVRRVGLLPITDGVAEALIRIFRIKLSNWDRHCMVNRDQYYPSAVCAASFDADDAFPDLTRVLIHLEIAPARDEAMAEAR